MRLAVLGMALGLSLGDSVRPMSEVVVSPPPPAVPALCLRDRPEDARRPPLVFAT